MRPAALVSGASSRPAIAEAETRAPLFFGHVDGPSPAARVTVDRPAHDRSAAVPVHDLSAIAPQSEGLFVALSTRGRAQWMRGVTIVVMSIGARP
ncbi:hypothetical protein [Bradyrhizobium zhanjiangense]|uniref:hypothetical protein n=1 Tax=Bradyrhizobium zhanjiangense TaxID=1325107 RepID=UPI001ABF0C4E|nr:hypothetical protein [Bradyrhizobium zhanjiangense]